MKKGLTIALAAAAILLFGLFALGSGESSGSTSGGGESSSKESVEKPTNENALGDYSVEIKSCRLNEDFEGKPVVIVVYGFTNNSNDKGSAFIYAIDDEVYQNGIGLNSVYVTYDMDDYDSTNSTKELKKGASIDVEQAYYLNDTETDITVEVSELISFDNEKITKVFSLVQ